MLIHIVLWLVASGATLAFVILFCGYNIRRVLAHFSDSDVTNSLMQLIYFLFTAMAFGIAVALLPNRPCAQYVKSGCYSDPFDPWIAVQDALSAASAILIGEAIIVGLMLIVIAGTYNRWISRQPKPDGREGLANSSLSGGEAIGKR